MAATTRIAEIQIDIMLEDGSYIGYLYNVNGGNALSEVETCHGQTIPEVLEGIVSQIEAAEVPQKKEATVSTSEVEYALVIDNSYHAVILRDLFLREAQKNHERAANATRRKVLDDAWEKHRLYDALAERCEHIRKEEAARIAAKLGVTQHEC